MEWWQPIYGIGLATAVYLPAYLLLGWPTDPAGPDGGQRQPSALPGRANRRDFFVARLNT